MEGTSLLTAVKDVDIQKTEMTPPVILESW